ncbi:MAG: WG repeat-containing protein [Oscillospiraceae bacterium]|nr:WG repeat-containing protein [Oscillospiraceae bacterium]
MKTANRLILAAGFLVLTIISWFAAISLRPEKDYIIQTRLMEQANAYLEDEIYILAAPLLEEAADYNTEYTPEAEEALKKVYLELIPQRGFRRRYISLLEKQMNRGSAPPEVFIEMAEFYLAESKYTEAFAVMKTGIARTNSDELTRIYEANRYLYRLGSSTFEDLTAVYQNTISVKNNGFWGVADYSGRIIIPCQYDKISTLSDNRVIVEKNGVISAVDRANNRIALLKEEILDFGNFTDERLVVLTDEGWRRATGDFVMGAAVFEDIGTYSEGYAAAKQNGKWGIIDRASSPSWFIPAEYEGAITDELGRSYTRGAVFMRDNGAARLFIEGGRTDKVYDDAKPFDNGVYAAAEKDGKWGFIDIAGELKIDYIFDDALSFSHHLAAVRQGEFWGYINLYGDIAIEPVFLQAKSFTNGFAPVLTERGWRFISLIEE